MGALANEAEFFKHDGMIKNFYYSNQTLFNHPALSLDLDDVLQEMRVLIINAIPKYDASKGAALSTYLYMHLSDRLKDLKAKIIRRSKFHAGYTEDLILSNRQDKQSDVDYKINYLSFKNIQGEHTKQDTLADCIDVKIILEHLKEDDRKLFVDRYLYGYSFSELQERHNKSNTYINKKLRRIDTIFETLRFQ